MGAPRDVVLAAAARPRECDLRSRRRLVPAASSYRVGWTTTGGCSAGGNGARRTRESGSALRWPPPPSPTRVGRTASGFGRTPERRREHLVHRLDGHELELLADLLGDVPEVLLVALGQDDHAGAREVGREDLALEPADRQHPAAERDLAGHRDVLADGDAGERAHHRGRHRDARGRTVLGDRPGRDVDVQGVLLEHLALDARARRRSTGSRTGRHEPTRA